MGRRELHTRFCLGNLRERDNLEDLCARRIILKWIFKKWDGQAWTGLIWLRIRTGSGLF
jgi:hypothetical protein